MDQLLMFERFVCDKSDRKASYWKENVQATIIHYCFQCSNMFFVGFDNVYTAYCGHSSENVSDSMKRTIVASTAMNECNSISITKIRINEHEFTH